MDRLVRSKVSYGLLMALALLPALVALGPHVEARLFPVLTETTVEAERLGDDIIVSTRFYKHRDFCVAELAVYDYKVDGGPAEEILTSGSWNRSTGGDTFLTRRFFFAGAWPGPGTLRRILWYRCHPLWLTPQPLTPLEVR